VRKLNIANLSKNRPLLGADFGSQDEEEKGRPGEPLLQLVAQQKESLNPKNQQGKSAAKACSNRTGEGKRKRARGLLSGRGTPGNRPVGSGSGKVGEGATDPVV